MRIAAVLAISRSDAVARRHWLDWCHRAVRSRIRPLVAFVKRFAVHGAFSKASAPIKVMAYGLRNDTYFFLEIRG